MVEILARSLNHGAPWSGIKLAMAAGLPPPLGMDIPVVMRTCLSILIPEIREAVKIDIGPALLILFAPIGPSALSGMYKVGFMCEFSGC